MRRGPSDMARGRQERLWTLARALRTGTAEDLSTYSAASGDTTPCAGAGTSSRSSPTSPPRPARTRGSGCGAWSARVSVPACTTSRLAEHRGTAPAETLDKFRTVIGSTTARSVHTPGYLGEVLVHAKDIRWPLRLRGTPSVEALTAVADFSARRDFTVASRTNVPGPKLRAALGRTA
jgi:hypothetical protein